MKNKKLSDKERLAHILDHIAYTEKALVNVNEEEFLNNFILNTAVTKWIEIIGEASYKISKEFKAANANIPWKNIEGLRHVLVHDYIEIDTKQLWYIIQTDIPELKQQIENLYNNFKIEE